ncbi:MAG: M56 family metallopeptidase [Mucilaginibacter sp.]
MGWWHYLLLVNFYLVLFFVFYALFLRRETFFQLNRIYLVVASLLSFFIPLIQSSWVKSLFITRQVQYVIYSKSVIIYKIKPVERILNLGNILEVLYILVVLCLILRLFWQLIVLKQAIEKPQPSTAYSFFKKISLGNNLSHADIIAEHEQVHATQLHTVDVLIIEIVMIINWFNPVVYLYRFAIKYIHEFIADREVLESGTDKADYALLLLSQTFDTSSHGLTSNFYNNSLLKERIIMLQKNKSKRIALAKYGLSVPLFILMLILSSASVINSKTIAVINKTAGDVLSTPASTQAIESKLELHNLSASLKLLTKQEIVSAAEDTYTDQNRDDLQLTAVSNNLSAITNSENTGAPVVFVPVERQPEFPGGIDKFYEILRNNLHYPDEMRKSHIEGKVFIQFTVEEDGSVTGLKTLRAPGYGSVEETRRVMSSLPKWIPGYQNGHAVCVLYTLPIEFKLVNTNPADSTSARTFTISNNTEDIAAALKKQSNNPILAILSKVRNSVSRNITTP